MYIVHEASTRLSSDDAGQHTTIKQRQAQAVTSRPKLIFRAETAIGLVSIWKSYRPACVVYDIHVEDAGAGVEIERQRLTRTSSSPLRHILFSSDGTTSFQFLEDAIESQPV